MLKTRGWWSAIKSKEGRGSKRISHKHVLMQHCSNESQIAQHQVTFWFIIEERRTCECVGSFSIEIEKVMGSLRHESRHLLYPPQHQQRNSPVPSTNSSSATMTSPISVLATQLKNSTSSSPSVAVLTGCTGGGKEPMNNNESMDSGVAGLRDGLTTPHGGSPTSAASSSSTSSSSHVLLNHHHILSPHHQIVQQQPSSSALATTPSSTLLLPPVHDDGLQYIVDRSKNTTYLKGRFLGKVIRLFFLQTKDVSINPGLKYLFFVVGFLT